MLRKIKKADKLYIVSSDIDVISKLRPTSAMNKYIELTSADLKEQVKDVKGKTERTHIFPVLMFDGSMYNSNPQTFLVQFHPKYGQGAFMVEAGKGESILADIPLPEGKLDAASWLVRVYLTDGEGG
jgi:hypothetical protein